MGRPRRFPRESEDQDIHTTCEIDQNCPEGYYCYKYSSLCSPCLNCTHFNRMQSSLKCPQISKHCGECKTGYSAEILNDGNQKDFCNPFQNNLGVSGSETTDGEILINPIYIFLIILCPLFFGIILYYIFKRTCSQSKCETNDNLVKTINSPTLVPSAPPIAQVKNEEYDKSTFDWSMFNDDRITSNTLIDLRDYFRDSINCKDETLTTAKYSCFPNYIRQWQDPPQPDIIEQPEEQYVAPIEEDSNSLYEDATTQDVWAAGPDPGPPQNAITYNEANEGGENNERRHFAIISTENRETPSGSNSNNSSLGSGSTYNFQSSGDSKRRRLDGNTVVTINIINCNENMNNNNNNLIPNTKKVEIDDLSSDSSDDNSD